MLILTRRIREEIVIADDIHVTFVAVKGHTVRLGITAPSSCPPAPLGLLAGSPRHYLANSRTTGLDLRP